MYISNGKKHQSLIILIILKNIKISNEEPEMYDCWHKCYNRLFDLNSEFNRLHYNFGHHCISFHFKLQGPILLTYSLTNSPLAYKDHHFTTRALTIILYPTIN